MAAAAPVSLILVVGLAAPASAAVTVSGASVSSDAAGDSFSVSCVGGHLGATGAGATGDPCEVITQVAVFPRAGGLTRERLQPAFAEENIDARVFFHPLSSLPMFDKQEGNVIAYDTAERAINLPSYHDITSQELNRVCSVIMGLR